MKYRLPMVEDVDQEVRDLLNDGYGFVDRVLGEVRTDALQKGMYIPCKRGCAACCRHPLNLSTVEMWGLIQELRTWSPQELAQLRRRLNDACKLAKKAKIDLRGVCSTQTARSAYIKARIPCPFLVGDVCGVYARRPLMCRTHLVVDTDPAECAKDGVVTHHDARKLVSQVTSFLHTHEEQLLLVPSLLMLRWAWAAIEERTLSFEDWKQSPLPE